MDYFYSIVLGAVQALTEFLPISSSGHLIVLHRLIDSPLLDSLTYDVILHAGTLLATFLFFKNDITSLLAGFFKTVTRFKITHKFDEQLPWLIILSAMPAALAGYFFGDQIENAFRSIGWVAAALIFGSVLFFIYERLGKKNRNLEAMSFSDAMLIGFSQVLAFLPGISRSGITIVAGLSLNFKRREAARFSFLLSLPVVLGASLQKVTQIPLSDLNTNFIFLALIGFLASALGGYVVIKYFIRFLENHSLNGFAVYRLLLAAALLLFYY